MNQIRQNSQSCEISTSRNDLRASWEKKGNWLNENKRKNRKNVIRAMYKCAQRQDAVKLVITEYGGFNENTLPSH